MKKCAVVSDSFKGTLSSEEICDIARECLGRQFPQCQVAALPVADGGEGTVACFHACCGGELVRVPVEGPFGESVSAAYLRLPGGRAVVEMASAAGLPLAEGRLDPSRASTYGVGQLLRHAVENGCREILLGLGGSCTNDGGCGCAAALGVCFTRRDGSPFVPTGGTLEEIAAIDCRESARLLEGVVLTAMCDVDTPLWGLEGASYMFAPQKGADAAMVEELDRQLRYLDRLWAEQLGRQVGLVPGAGAAGGLGGGLLAFFGASLRPGVEAVLDLVSFDALLDNCDVVFTGEGRLDRQSLRGKVVGGVAQRARRRNIPVVVIAGSVAPEIEDICRDPQSGVSAVFSINRQAIDFSQSRAASRENYARTMENILRLMKLSGI